MLLVMSKRTAFPRAPIARNLKRLLKRRGLSAVALSERINRNPIQVSQWLNDHTQPGAGALVALADALDVTLDVLVR